MADLREILRQYLEFCSSEINRLDDQLASNAILEWRGVTVKGRSRIAKFLRHKQQNGLVQEFTDATAAAPFEERDTHVSTMLTPPENLVVQSTASSEPPASLPDEKPADQSVSPDMNLSFETPPRVHPTPCGPPPLTTGHRFLPLSPSDEEEDEPDPNRPESPSSSSDQPRQNVYSELQYLEAIGTLRSSHESKHRGTRTTHHIPRDDTPPPSDGPSTPTRPRSSFPSGDSDKRTKLKMSYRKHLRSQDPQFALIIYEDLTPRSSKVRRNLFSDESLPTEPPDASEAATPSPIRSHQPPPNQPSPEAQPLPETPSPPPAETTPPHTPLEPPGTPHHRQRRLLPPAGFRTSPRRSRAIMDFTIATDDSPTSSTSSSNSPNNNNNNTLQTWPRKNPAAGGCPPGGSVPKNRKLASSSSTVRKPLRF